MARNINLDKMPNHIQSRIVGMAVGERIKKSTNKEEIVGLITGAIK